MKTDDLIAMLSTNVEQVNRRRLVQIVAAAIAIGAALVIAAVFVVLGIRPDLMKTGALAFLFLKLVFTLTVLVPASVFLIRLARPGGERKARVALLVLPFVGIIVLAAVSLAFTPSSHWATVALGDQWIECLLSIPIIAIVPFAVIVWAVRQTAPTDLTRAGALAGLVAGTVSAIGYALHCTDDSLPFIALWYGGTIALCTFAGAKLGPRLLRW
ncbi:MAG: DUF1109 domain-containing protein [Bradyrhizobiaceae bacterium]|nr:MAG: DUF1109 domain-containing protein [Bradyrhizobiaceae bacterium]